MAEQPSWPIIIISSSNTFLHVGETLKSLQDHIVEDSTLGGHSDGVDLVLEFYDSRGRVLEPILNQAWVLTGVQVTPNLINKDTLLTRMGQAIASGETDARSARVELEEHALTPEQIDFYTGPRPKPNDSIKTFANALLNDPSYAPPPLGTVIIDIGRGGWLHNAWHAAFG